MKKIVSMLAIAALTLGAVSAADFSVEYVTKGSIYTETSTTPAGSTKSTVNSKAFLDQDGYDGDSASDLVMSASGDAGGVLLDIDVDARDKTIKFDQVYGWMNFGPIQLTTGKWSGRYVNRVREDAGSWANDDFEKFKPGIVAGDNGKGAQGNNAYDVDNLTAVKGTNQIATALAYTSRPNDSTYFMAKGLIVTNNWGSAGQFDSDKNYSDGNRDFIFESGFAGEVAFRQEGLIDINVLAKSMVRNELVVAAFVRPLMLNPVNLMVGVTYAGDLKDNGDAVDTNAYAYGIDLRARIPLSDALALTTMNNVSNVVEQKAKNGKDNSTMSMWNMVSVAYKVSEALTVQVTGESYMSQFMKIENDDAVGRDKLGGADLSVLAGVVYKFNPNASFSAGVKYERTGVFASSDWTDANDTKATFSIPFVFDVAL